MARSTSDCELRDGAVRRLAVLHHREGVVALGDLAVVEDVLERGSELGRDNATPGSSLARRVVLFDEDAARVRRLAGLDQTGDVAGDGLGHELGRGLEPGPRVEWGAKEQAACHGPLD